MESDTSANLIEYILTHTKLSQADLARKLKVSRAQISKWKAGDRISSDRNSQLLSLAGLFDTVNEEWAMFAKSQENAEAWYAYVFEILEDVEWGDVLKDFLHDIPDIYVAHLILDLRKLGAKIDSQAPETRWTDVERFEPTPLASALFSILESWGQLSDWSNDWLEFDDLPSAAESEMFDVTSELEWCVADLALDYADREPLTALGVDKVKLAAKAEENRRAIYSRLQEMCRIRVRHGLPICEDYFQLLYVHPEDLADMSWFRPSAARVDEHTIRSYLPYGQRLILLIWNAQQEPLGQIDEKLNRILEKIDTNP